MAEQIKCCMCKEELELNDVAGTDSKGQSYCDGCQEVANDMRDIINEEFNNNFEC